MRTTGMSQEEQGILKRAEMWINKANTNQLSSSGGRVSQVVFLYLSGHCERSQGQHPGRHFAKVKPRQVYVNLFSSVAAVNRSP